MKKKERTGTETEKEEDGKIIKAVYINSLVMLESTATKWFYRRKNLIYYDFIIRIMSVG